jgi:hypothetical protein
MSYSIFFEYVSGVERSENSSYQTFGAGSIYDFFNEKKLYETPFLAKETANLRDPWWKKRKIQTRDCLSIFKIEKIFTQIVKHLNKQDSENFEAIVWNNGSGEKAIRIFNIFLIFENISKYLPDDDKASFHQAVKPTWEPWFYTKPADWILVSRSWRFDLVTARRFSDKISWRDVVVDGRLLWALRDVANWDHLSETRHFTTKEMIEFQKYISFKILAENQELTTHQRRIVARWSRNDNDTVLLRSWDGFFTRVNRPQTSRGI